MVSLLATCCGSTQPASEPTAKVRVPPDRGVPAVPLATASPEPQAESARRARAATVGAAAVRIDLSRCVTEVSRSGATRGRDAAGEGGGYGSGEGAWRRIPDGGGYAGAVGVDLSIS